MTKTSTKPSTTKPITCTDTRRMRQSYDDPAGDVDMVGELKIEMRVDGSPARVATMYATAETIRACSDRGDYLCPHGDSRLRVIGATDDGMDVLIQIFRGARKCDAVPAVHLEHLDPADYSQDPAAAKSIAWMRDVAKAIVGYRSAIIAGLVSTRTSAGDAMWEAMQAAERTEV